MKLIFKTEKLSIGYQKEILDNIDVEVHEGEFIAIIGENGKGKSTFLRTLAADLPALNGSIELYGKDIKKWSNREISSRIAAVWTQKPSIGLISVDEFIAFGRYPFTNWLAKLKTEDREQIDQALILCGITDLKKKDIQSLSDGERQKVSIARAIAQNTDIILLDEPTTHLDIKNTAEIFYLLKKLSVEHNKTIVLSTHKIDIGLQLADQVIIITEGIVEQDTAEKLIAKGRIQKEFETPILCFDPLKRNFYFK